MTYTNNMQVIEQVFAPLEGRSIVDVGCGRGRLLRALMRRGAVPTGVDPSADLLAKAADMAPGAALHRSGGEAMPFADDTFDGAIFLNSLHHVPQNLIRPALAEALRVIRPGAPLLVIEPLARGGYQEVFAPLDDETEVRAGALAHLAAFRAEEGVETTLDTEYDTDLKEVSADDMLGYALAIDPSRAEKIDAVRDEVVRLFSDHARETDGGFLLDQPMIAVAMRKGVPA
jgi:SAM-dependent methyltransferase